MNTMYRLWAIHILRQLLSNNFYHALLLLKFLRLYSRYILFIYSLPIYTIILIYMHRVIKIHKIESKNRKKFQRLNNKQQFYRNRYLIWYYSYWHEKLPIKYWYLLLNKNWYFFQHLVLNSFANYGGFPLSLSII